MSSATIITHRAARLCNTRAELTAFLALARPADIIFGMALPLGPTRMIRNVQAIFRYAERACAASHVAIYGGSGSVLHATFPNGCVEEDAAYFLGREVVVATWHHPARGALEGMLLAEARAATGRPYEMGRAFMQSIGASSGLREPFVCSTYASSVFRSVMRRDSPLHHDSIARQMQFVSPAHLFVQPGLVDP